MAETEVEITVAGIDIITSKVSVPVNIASSACNYESVGSCWWVKGVGRCSLTQGTCHREDGPITHPNHLATRGINLDKKTLD